MIRLVGGIALKVVQRFIKFKHISESLNSSHKNKLTTQACFVILHLEPNQTKKNMKFLKDLVKTGLNLYPCPFTLELPEELLAILDAPVAETVATTLTYQEHKLRIGLQMVGGTEALVWVGPKRMLPGRKGLLFLRREKLVAVLLGQVQKDWEIPVRSMPAVIDSLRQIIADIPHRFDSPNFQADPAKELLPLEHELDLV
jgi:hypothetical protein